MVSTGKEREYKKEGKKEKGGGPKNSPHPSLSKKPELKNSVDLPRPPHLRRRKELHLLRHAVLSPELDRPARPCGGRRRHREDEREVGRRRRRRGLRQTVLGAGDAARALAVLRHALASLANLSEHPRVSAGKDAGVQN
jgi:hypothetical protein